MKQLTILISLLILSLVAFGQKSKLKNLDQNKGLGTVKIGDKKQFIQNLIPLKSAQENYDWFKKADETSTFHGIKLNSISYGFFNDKVFQIEAMVDSADYEPVKAVFERLYGSPKTLYGGTHHFTTAYPTWLGKKVILILYGRILVFSLLDAEEIKRKTWRKQKKQAWKEEWEEERKWYKGIWYSKYRRERKRKFKEKDKQEKKEDKEYIEYQQYQLKHNLF